MFRKLIFLAILFLVSANAIAQQVDTAWVRRYNGPGNGGDYARAIAVDGSGNVYVTGQSEDSTSLDYATLRYDPAGNQLWVQRYNGPGNSDDVARAIGVDDSGNVYVTGYSVGSGTSTDYATIKYDPSGNQLWVQRYNGSANSADEASAIAVDGSGNVYVTGASEGSGTAHDYATIKYDPAGDQLWVKTYNGPGNADDIATAIAVDGSGNVYITGRSIGIETQYDYATIKYDPAGTQLWVQRYDGPVNGGDVAYAIAVDGSGNVYVTGFSTGSGTGFDYATIKYDPAGNQLWVKTYNALGHYDDEATAIAVDGSGNVFVTGYSVSSDHATIKYDPSGNQLWVQKYNGRASAIALDGSGNVYVTGYSWGSGTADDYATIKYDPAGNQIWVQRYNGPANSTDFASAIAVDGSGNVYVTGWSTGSGTSTDYATVKYWQNHTLNSFSLLSPLNADSVKTTLTFHWQTSIDPDPNDTVRYDLYLSRSIAFNPDSTIIYDSLLDTTLTDSLGPKLWHWKVKAYDKWGAVRWSDQTWSFYVNSCPDSYSLMTPANADSIRTRAQFKWHNALDPDNDSVHYDLYLSRSFVFAPESTKVYDSLLDTTFTDSLAFKNWYWKVKAYDKWGATRWSDQTWSFYVYLSGDVNADSKVTVSDVVYLINFLFKGGPAPKPYRTGEVNCDGYITVADVVYLVNYLFKGGKAPCS